MSLEEAVENGDRLLIDATERLLRTMVLGATITMGQLEGDSDW